MNRTTKSIVTAIAGAFALCGPTTVSAQTTIDIENRFPHVGAIMVWIVDDVGKPVELRGFVSGTLIRDRVMVTAGHFTAPATTLGCRHRSDETWALWGIPSYVCSGDSGGGIFLSPRPTVADGQVLVANVRDGGLDCRRHNNNNRLDTRSIQDWISDMLRRHAAP